MYNAIKIAHNLFLITCIFADNTRYNLCSLTNLVGKKNK